MEQGVKLANCTIKVSGNKNDCEKAIELLQAHAIWGETNFYKLRDGFVGSLVIENDMNYILFNLNTKNNLLDLGMKYKFDFEVFCENKEDCFSEYFLVKKGIIVSEKRNEYHYCCDFEELQELLKEYDYLSLDDFEDVEDLEENFVFGRMNIEFTI